jgi:hypothetical protein
MPWCEEKKMDILGRLYMPEAPLTQPSDETDKRWVSIKGTAFPSSSDTRRSCELRRSTKSNTARTDVGLGSLAIRETQIKGACRH